MRKEDSGSILDPINAFNINRLNNINNYETGLSASVGLDYEIIKKDQKLDFSIAQVINEKENKKMSSKTSLDEKLSDLVFSTNYQINNKINFRYNSSIDQNYNDINFNDIGAEINLMPLKIDFNYLEENKHIGDKNILKLGLVMKKKIHD